MKKVFMIGLCLVVAGIIGYSKGSQEVEAYYEQSVTNITNIVAADNHSVAGIKVDAPNLIQLSEKTTLGIEGGKNIMKDVFRNDTRDYFESDKGYFIYLKVTYSGCLLNCKGE